MNDAIWADVVVVIHFLYAAFVVTGFLAIPLGGVLGWRWVRNLPFRLTHLAAIVLVAFQDVIGVTCPLTTLEYHLRVAGSMGAGEGAFIARWASRLLYLHYPQWVFSVAYLALALLALLLLWWVPPFRRRKPAP